MPFSLASFLQRVEFLRGTWNGLPLPTLNTKLAKSSTSGDAPAARFCTTASPVLPNKRLSIGLTPRGNGFALQKHDICGAEVVLETSEGIAALGHEGDVSEGAAAGWPAFKWAVIRRNGKTFPRCKHGRGLFICLLKSWIKLLFSITWVWTKHECLRSNLTWKQY